MVLSALRNQMISNQLHLSQLELNKNVNVHIDAEIAKETEIEICLK
tara:strand:+ start:892 stop:1029 length:138 start_codon:yes stop_codon:yes gene_type:complete